MKPIKILFKDGRPIALFYDPEGWFRDIIMIGTVENAAQFEGKDGYEVRECEVVVK
jgi:hypothetical protein